MNEIQNQKRNWKSSKTHFRENLDIGTNGSSQILGPFKGGLPQYD